MEQMLLASHDLSQTLQKKDQDILNVMVLVEETVLAVRNMRMNGYDALLEKVVHFCEQHVIPVPDMSAVYVRTGRPRRNALMDTNDHMFHVDLFTAALDKLLIEHDNRFSAE